MVLSIIVKSIYSVQTGLNSQITNVSLCLTVFLNLLLLLHVCVSLLYYLCSPQRNNDRSVARNPSWRKHSADFNPKKKKTPSFGDDNFVDLDRCDLPISQFLMPVVAFEYSSKCAFRVTFFCFFLYLVRTCLQQVHALQKLMKQFSLCKYVALVVATRQQWKPLNFGGNEWAGDP